MIAPSFLAEGVDTPECDLWGACDYDHLNSVGLVTVTDNCELSHVDAVRSPLVAGMTTSSTTRPTTCAATSTFQQIVIVVDRTPAEFTFAPADIALECSDAGLTGMVEHELGEFYAVEFTPGDGMHAEAWTTVMQKPRELQ